MAADNELILQLKVEGEDRVKAAIRGTINEAQKLDNVTQDSTESIKQFFDNYHKGHLSLQADARRSAEQLEELRKAGLISGDQYQEARKAIEELSKEAKKAREQLRYMQTENKGAVALSQGLRGATAAMEGLVGASALFGEKNKSLEQGLIKLNSVMLIGNAIKETSALITEQSTLKLYAAEKAQALYTLVVGESTGALKLFRLALAGTGIGLAVIAIGYLINKFSEYNEEVNKSTEANEKLKTAIDELSESQKTYGDQLSTQLQYLKNIGQLSTKDQINKLLVNATKNAEDARFAVFGLQQQYNDLTNDLSKLDKDSPFYDITKQRIEELEPELIKAKNLFNSNQDAVNTLTEELNKLNSTTTTTTSKTKELVENMGGSLVKTFRDFKGRGFIGALIDTGQAKTKQEAQRAGIKIGEEIQKGVTKSAEGGKMADAILAKAQENAQKAQSYYSVFANAASDAQKLIQNATSIRFQKEQDELDEKKKRGLISEKQYAAAINKLKNEQAQKDHRAAVVTAFMMIPQAILSAFTNTQTGIIGKGIAAGIAGGFATAQAIAVAASPVPRFFKGVLNLQDSRHPSGIDTVPAMLTKGESVMTVDETKKHFKVLKAIREKRFDKMYVPKDLVNPVLAMHDREVEGQDFSKMYEHLATIGSYMKQDYKTNQKGVSVLHEINKNIRSKKGYV